MPRPNTYGSPPLSRTTTSPRRARSTSSGVDLLLRGGPPARDLGDVDDLDALAQAVQHGQRRQPVHDDDVGLGQRPGSRAGSAARGRPGRRRPGRRGRRCRPGRRRQPAGRASSRSSASTAVSAASRRAAARRGSRSPCTLTVAGPLRPVAGIHAEAVRASSTRRQKVRWASASRRTASLTSGSAVHAIASQQPARSPSAYTRGCQSRCPRSARSCRAGTTSGATTVTTRAGGQQRPHPAQRDGPSADDDTGRPPGAGPAAAAARRGPRRSPGVHEQGVQVTTSRTIRATAQVTGAARSAGQPRPAERGRLLQPRSARVRE